MTSSNELNMILKAKVVKLKVELDYKGSLLPAQVDGITKKLANKPVKLKVKLDLTIKDFNTQLGLLKTKINTSKTAIAPIKIGVQLDIKGSATAIKNQLKDIHTTVDAFNKKYSKQIQEMQQKTQQTGKVAGGITVPTVNTASYLNSLKDAEKYMKNTFGKGLFSSQELKNANGELLGFTTSLTKANGVVQKIRYDWDANKAKFTPVSQKTLTETEKSVSKALDSLKTLDKEISKLGSNQGKFWKESQSLYNDGGTGKLTQNAVDSLRRRITDEQALESAIKRENNLLRQQRELIAQISREQKNMTNKQSKSQLGELKNSLSGIDVNGSMSKNQIADIRSQFNAIKDSYDSQIVKEKQLATASKKRLDLLAEIGRLERTNVLSSGKGAMSSRYIEETKQLANNIKTMAQYEVAKKRMDATNRERKNVKIDDSIALQLDKLKKSMFAFATETGRSQSVIEKRYASVAQAVGKNLRLATNEVAKWDKMLSNFKTTQALEQRRNSIVKNADNAKISGFISKGDSEGLKQYIADLNRLKVAQLSVNTDNKGVTRITAQFASAKKTAKELTYEIDRVDKQLRLMGQRDAFNSNRNLGVFEQLKIAMARVPVWMVAMTAFYGTLNSVKQMSNEIFKLDKSLTELRRVADSQINIEHVFEGSIGLAKELGNNVHDVMQSVSDLARTFGHFNERQLLSIAKTSTLMSNVSDLTAQEATESLIGTMNAFNITAEDSIRIVDALNEVDNNYAISTKQLATGLAKSASTSKTFGVTLEENVGHITAIGAVTMESGNIIGNSLKTIYSRITTMAGAEEALSSVGVAINDMATGEIRDVSDILADLALRWDTISASERQNIAVKVAGRYQLSRFLALMNNFKMSSEATTTALTSEGSAMRENAEYMKSYEARINQMKNGFTELSSAVGEAFLSAGLSTGIKALTKLADLAVTVVDNFGALPIVFGALALVLIKFTVFDAFAMKMIHNARGVKTAFTTASASATGFAGTMLKTQAVATKSFAVISAGASTMASKVGGAFKRMTTASALVGGGSMIAVIAGFILIGKAIEHFSKKMEEARIKEQELVKLNDKMVTSFRASGDGLQGMMRRYNELNSASELTIEQQQELAVITKSFAEQLPTTISHIDASGKAHLISASYIEEEINAVRLLSKEQALLTTMKYTENMKKESDGYQEIIGNIEKLVVAREKLENQHGTRKGRESSAYGYVDTSAPTDYYDNTKAIQQNKVDVLMAESQKTGAIQSTILAIQGQSIAMMEASGQAIGLGDAQKQVMDDVARANEGMLRSAENVDEWNVSINDLYDASTKVGGVLAETFELATKDLEGQPEKIEEVSSALSRMAQAIPKDFLKLDESLNTADATDKIVRGIKEIANVSMHIEAGSTNSIELRDRLMEAGLEAGEASFAISELARQHDNLGLLQDSVTQGLEGTTGAMIDQTEAVMDSVDAMEILTGYGKGELDGLKSHIETLEILKQKHKEGAESTAEWKESENAIADFLNVTGTEVRNNIHDYNILVGALQNAKIATDEQGGSYIDLSEETSGLTEKQRELIKSWLDAGGNADFVTGKNKEVADSYTNVKDAYDKGKITNAEYFPIIETPIGKNFISDIQDALKGQKDLNQSMLDGFGFSSNTVTNVTNAGKGLISVKEGVDEVGESVDTTGEKVITVGGILSDSFTKASSIVGAKSDYMIGKNKLQTSALDDVAQSARDANRDLINVNSTALNTMSTLSRTQAKISATSGVASSNGLSLGGFRMASLGEVSTNVASSISAYSDSISSTFSATAGEGGGSLSGGGEGTSGVIKAPTFNPFEALHNTSGASKYSTSASKTSSTAKKSTTTVKKATVKKATANKTTASAEELAELYVIDLLNRNRNSYEGTLGQIEAKMNALTKGTIQYRDSVKSALAYENKIFTLDTKSLAVTVARNIAIDKRIKALGSPNKQNKSQRDEYNKLQQEYDSNISKIASLKQSVETLKNEIKIQSESIFIDFIEEIVSKYDTAIDVIKKKTEDIDFKLEVHLLTSPDNIKEQLNLLAKKSNAEQEERNTVANKKETLTSQYNSASKKHGVNSSQAKKVKEELDAVKEAWESATIAVLNTEKEIKDVRGSVADEGIKQLKDYYQNMKEMASDAIEAEKKQLEEAHDLKMTQYDEQSKAINKVYDDKLKLMDEEKSQAEYQGELDEKNMKKQELLNKISLLSRDKSLEGRKKVEELKKELTDSEKEISAFMKSRQEELLREGLEAQKQAQLDKIEASKTEDQTAHDKSIEMLDKEVEEVSAKYDKILDDEKLWADKRSEFIKGNFSELTNELQTMSKQLSDMSKGDFDSLTSNFKNFSEDVKQQIKELNALNLKNMNFTSAPIIDDVKEVGGATKPAVINTGTKVNLPTYETTPVAPAKPKAGVTPKPAPKPAPAPRYYSIKKGDTLWDIAKAYYGNGSQWSKIANANKSVNASKLQVGKKLLIPFRDGGYTGDWAGNEGKVALLHKKEVVLNQKQTSDILDTAKIMDKMKSFIPNLKRNNPLESIGEGGMNITNNYELNIQIERLNGDKEGANTVVKEIMKGLKKMGR